MKNLLNPIDQQTAMVVLNELQQRLSTHTEYSYLFRGSEGKSLQAQARHNLRWHQLFHTMNRREQV